MKVDYKVTGYNPDYELIEVEFTRPDSPSIPWVRRFNFPDFTKEKLIDHIRAVASGIAGSWERIPNHPPQLTIPDSGTLDVEPELYLPYEPNPQYEEEPEWDKWTQDLIPGEITSPTQETIPWIVRDLTPEEVQARLDEAAEAARQERNFYLLQSDYIFCSDVEIQDKEAWRLFRQALRDLPQQDGFPQSIDWPERPQT